MNIILFGPPACGKGTQAKALVADGMTHFSTGDMLRAEVASGSSLGAEIDAVISKGNYASDELVTSMIAARFRPCGSYLFDGFPRTVAQAAALDSILAAAGEKIDILINLKVDRSVLLGRIAKRFATDGRSDDNPEVFTERLKVFDELTLPVLAHYEAQGCVKDVDAMIDAPTLSQVISILVGWHR
jgi:adenylate kinase